MILAQWLEHWELAHVRALGFDFWWLLSLIFTFYFTLYHQTCVYLQLRGDNLTGHSILTSMMAWPEMYKIIPCSPVLSFSFGC